MKLRRVSLIVILVLAGIISIAGVYALTSISMPETASLNEIAISINPDAKGIYKDVYFAKDNSIASKITLSGCVKDVCYDKQTLSYKIPSDWKGTYAFLFYDYKKGEWISTNFSITEKTETAGTAAAAEKGKAGKASTAGIDLICKYIKFQNKSTIDNSTLLLCENQKEELKKAIGKGRLKKPKGIDVKESRIIEKQGAGTIRFKDTFDIDSKDADEASGNANIYIENGIVAINTDELPELEQPATITLYNLSFESTPAIYYNEGFTTKLSEVNKPCPVHVCTNINYNNATGTLSFDVAHFSTYLAYSWGGGINGACGDQLVSYCAANPDYCKQYVYPYDGTVKCYPTAFCAQSTFCSAWYGDRLELAGGPDGYGCDYKPSAGTQNATCLQVETHYFHGDCPSGCNRLYGDWCSCFSTTSCATCEGSMACNMADCYQSCAGGEGCIWCVDDCRNNCGGVGYRTEPRYCQPKVCSSPTGDIGKCYYGGSYYYSQYYYNPDWYGYGTRTIFDLREQICPKDTKKWKMCSNTNDEPCGEWVDTSYNCYAERNEFTLTCNDASGEYQDYCENNEILNRYVPVKKDYSIPTYDMYGFLYDRTIRGASCNITKQDCAMYGQVCSAAKRKCNNIPTASVSLKPSIYNSAYIDKYNNPLDNADLNCTASITDYDAEDKTLYGKYEIIKQDAYGQVTLASGTASCNKPLIQGYTDRYNTACPISIPLVSNTDTSRGDVILCNVIPNDGYVDGKISNDIVIIAPLNLAIDKDYLEDKSINVDEYLTPAQINEGGQLKEYLVGTEYDTLVCRADGLTGNVNFEIFKGDSTTYQTGGRARGATSYTTYRQLATKQVDCTLGSECKAVFEVGENEAIKGWPRGEKITCRASAVINSKQLQVESEKLVVAKHVYTFIHIKTLDNPGFVTNAKEQFDYYLDLSALDYSTAKPIYYGTEYACDVGAMVLGSMIKDCFNELFGKNDVIKDRIVGMYSAHGFFDSLTGVVVISGGTTTLAHEIGHSYNLADEYDYNSYLKLSSPLNPYPKCAGDHPTTTKEEKREGNNCYWYDFSEGYCLVAGMPLPNHYNTPSDLNKQFRSIMGGGVFSGSLRQYPAEACYPLTERQCDTSLSAVESACPLGSASNNAACQNDIPPNDDPACKASGTIPSDSYMNGNSCTRTNNQEGVCYEGKCVDLSCDRFQTKTSNTCNNADKNIEAGIGWAFGWMCNSQAEPEIECNNPFKIGENLQAYTLSITPQTPDPRCTDAGKSCNGVYYVEVGPDDVPKNLLEMFKDSFAAAEKCAIDGGCNAGFCTTVVEGKTDHRLHTRGIGNWYNSATATYTLECIPKSTSKYDIAVKLSRTKYCEKQS